MTWKYFWLSLSVMVLFSVGPSQDCGKIQESQARYIAFGDSATAGADQPTYPQVLEALLHANVVNEGKGGETAQEGVNRLQSILRGVSYPKAQSLLYWEGGNDLIDFVQSVDPYLQYSPKDPDYPYSRELDQALAKIGEAVESAVQTAQRHNLQVYVATYFYLLPFVAPCDAVPVPFLNKAQVEKTNDYIDLLNRVIRETASNFRDITLVDINQELGALLGDKDNFVNCNHPSGEGNQLIAQEWFEHLQ